MLKVVEKIEEANCVTHSGTMHADDVFSTAFLEIYLKSVRVFRTNNINAEDYKDKIVYDVGRGKFDHHKEDILKRNNGIPYAAFGLLWQEYGLDLLKKTNIENPEEVFIAIDRDFIEGIDADDNGVFPKIEAPYSVKTVSDIIKIFNPSYESSQDSNTQFFRACSIAKTILTEEIIAQEAKVKAKKIVEEKIKKCKKKYLLLDEFLPYEDTLLSMEEANDIGFVIFPSNRGGYAIKTVPKSKEDRTYRIDVPEEYAGLEGKELEEKSGIKGLIFCHRTRFMMSTKSRTAAIKVVKSILQED